MQFTVAVSAHEYKDCGVNLMLFFFPAMVLIKIDVLPWKWELVINTNSWEVAFKVHYCGQGLQKFKMVLHLYSELWPVTLK